MIDFDQTYFGCGNKVPAWKLMELLNKKDFTFLAPDNCIKDIDNKFLYSTVDTVFPFTSDIETYVKATVLHCANDLISIAVRPIQACVSIGLSLQLTEHDLRCIFKNLESSLNELNINSENVNYHTFMADQTSITISMNGISNFIRERVHLHGAYSIYLTKPIGSWSAVNSKDKSILFLKNNIDFLDLLEHQKIVYSTDISGYGLIGHLLPFLQSENYFSELCMNSLLSRVNKEKEQDDSFLGCSTKSNIESFKDYIDNSINHLGIPTLEALFGGEINGPIMIIANRNEISEIMLDKVKELIHVGSIYPLKKDDSKLIRLIK